MTPLLVLTTVGAAFDPSTLANDLVEQRLAACVNIMPKIRSIYRWQNKIEDEGEQMLVIKTAVERLEALREALFARHPYEVPEFVVVRIDDLSPAYREWLLSSL